jgi:DNA-binding GntR family transcriptional regulator
MNKEQMEKYLKANPFEQLSKIVYTILFDEITSLNIKPATKLNATQIASDLDISRTPVTDALRMLSEIGFVEVYPDKNGYYVSALNRHDIIKLYTVRAVVEGKAAFLCAQLSNCPHIEELEKLADKFQDSFEIKKYEIIKSTDIPFHQLIMKACGNEYLQQCYKLLEKQLQRYQWFSIKFVQQDKNNPITPELIAQHSAIVNSIKLHIPELAQKAMENHIQSCLNHTRYFTDKLDPFMQTLNL